MSKQQRTHDAVPGGAPALRDDVQRLASARALADACHDAVLLAGGDGTVRYANAAATRLFGSPGEALTGRDLRTVVPGCPGELDGDGAGHDWQAEVLMRREGVMRIDARLRALDPVHPTLLALTATWRAHDADAPPDPEAERWALAARGSSDGFWHRPDVGLDTAWWSPRLYELLGYTEGEIEPRYSALLERVHPDDRERFLSVRERELLRGAALDTEVRLRHRSGAYRHFRLRALVTRERDGRPVSLSGSLQDVTELRCALDALAANESRMRDLAAAGSDFFFEMDENFTITWLSQNFTHVTGIERAALLHRTVQQRRPEGVRTEEWDRYVEILERREPFRDLIRTRELPDGRLIYASLSASPVLDEQGRFRGFRGCGTDVTDRMRMEAALRESEQRFRALVDNAPLEIYLKDLEGRYVLVNDRVAKAWGRPEESIIGLSAADLFEPDFVRATEAEDREVLARNQPLSSEFTADRQGRRTDLSRVKFPIPDADGRPAGIAAITHDVTERNRTLRALETSERRFRDFAELAADYLWETDENSVFTFLSEGFREVNGVAPEAVLGRRASEVFEERCDDEEMQARHLGNVAARRATQLELTRERPDGSSVRVFVSAKPIVDGDGSFRGYRGITRDVTEAHELSARLAFQATHDALTGLVNRSEFERRLDRLLESARRDDSSHALCYLDLDQFKVVNDTCGHLAGDALLERLAETLTFRVRQRDTVARLGGDEFAVLIEHCSLAQATRVASALHQAISEFVFTWEERQFQVGASIGLVPITPDLGDAADVLSAADSACYVAKDQGRNRIHVYAKDDAELTRRRGEMDWVSHISGALAENRFRLRAQPVLPLSPRNAGAHHCELLIVMLDRDGNEIQPGAFFPAAERYNLATRIDRWVVRAALRWLSGDDDARGRPSLTGINLSAQSLGEPDFLAYVRGECERQNVPASRLCFEITETAAIANLDTARRFMDELKRDGARFALDDFGKGLSSFGYLRSLPVDYIKIDAQFVRDLTTDPVDLAMVRSINEVARLMNKQTIAEGVEKHETLKALRDVGVDYAQGFAIARPRFI